MRSARRAPTGRPILALCAALAVLSGCRTGSPLHSRYNNFRAYFNTYYNATRSLEEGERTVQTPNTRVDLGRLVELYPSGASAGTRNPAFQAAIDKSAELLRARGTSSLADDALLVIGKAYFYQRNLVGAEQKFRETMAAATARDDRRLADEARRWRAQMGLALAELYAWAGRWDDAAPALREGLRDIRDDDLAARGYLLLGQVEEAAGRFDDAAEAYRQAAARRPTYEIEYAALVSEALVLGLDSRRPDESLAILRAMRRDDKHYARRAEVALAQARVMARAGDADGAETLFRDVLYDENLAGQSVRGVAHARLAEFYRDVREDFVLASAHFDTAATAIPAEPTAADRPSREALLGLGRQSTTFGSVATTSRRLAEIDSLMALGALDDDAFAARIAEIEAARYRTWQDEQRRLAAVRTAQDFGGTVGGTFTGSGSEGRPGESDGRDDPPSGAVPGGLPGAAPGVDAGFLSYRDPSSLQNGLISFQRTWGDRPLVPDWRRLAAIQAGGLASGVGGGPSGTSQRGLAAQGPGPLDLSAVPRSPEQRSALVLERASLRYELANAFFLSLERADLARTSYLQVLDDTPDAPVAYRARYALAELEAAEGNAARAAELYASVAAADPESDLGRAAQARAEGREPERDRRTRSAADLAYAEARALWTAGQPLAAARALVLDGDADPDAPTAPRAFFAAAAAYADWAAGDSLRLTRPLPDSLAPAALIPFVPVADSPVPEPAIPTPTPDSPVPAPPTPAATPSDDRVPGESLDASPDLRDAAGDLAADSLATSGLPADSPERPEERPEPVRPAEPAPPGGVLAPPAPSPVAPPPDQVDPARPAEARTPADSLDGPRPGPPDVPAPDSLDVPAGPVLTLDAYLAALAERYPESAYAAPAQALRAALGPEPDPDATPDEDEEPVVAAPVAPPADDPGGLRGRTPPDPARGGVSYKLQTFATRDEADAVAESLRGSRYRVAVLTDGALFYVMAGQFEDVAAGEAVRDQLPSWASTRAILIPIADLTAPGAPGAPPAGPPATVGSSTDG